MRYGKQAIRTASPTTLAGFFLALREHDRREALGALSALPVEILGGALDRLLPAAEHSSRIAELLPGARLTIAEGAAHMLPLERPQLVTAAISRIIDMLRRSAPEPGPGRAGGRISARPAQR